MVDRRHCRASNLETQMGQGAYFLLFNRASPWGFESARCDRNRKTWNFLGCAKTWWLMLYGKRKAIRSPIKQFLIPQRTRCYCLIFPSVKTHHLENERIYDTIYWGGTPPMQAPTNCPSVKVSSWLRCTGFFCNFTFKLSLSANSKTVHGKGNLKHRITSVKSE